MNSSPKSVVEQEDPFAALPREVKAKLQYYVYQYSDPRTDEPFYIGKGCGDRLLSHLSVAGDCLKSQKMNELREAGLAPKLLIIRHGMTESEAFAVESVLIEHIGVEKLTNKVAGHHTSSLGIMSLDQIRSVYAAEPVDSFKHASLLIRLPRIFRYSMTPLELFEAVCGTWVIGENRNNVELVMPVHDGVVQEIYDVKGKESWQPGGTRQYQTRQLGKPDPGRREFDGPVCEDAEIRNRYHLKRVDDYFEQGSRNPIRYVWPATDELDKTG